MTQNPDAFLAKPFLKYPKVSITIAKNVNVLIVMCYPNEKHSSRRSNLKPRISNCSGMLGTLVHEFCRFSKHQRKLSHWRTYEFLDHFCTFHSHH